MLSLQFKGLDKLTKDLKTTREKALPYAARNALTTTAFEARRIWQREIRKEYTLRNAYTERSIIAVKAHGHLPHMQSEVGSFAPFMGDREDESVARGRTGHHRAIPAPSAAGGAPGSKSRPRVVTSGNRLGRLNLTTPKGKSKAQRNAIAIRMAIRGNKLALLERSKGGKAIFRIAGGQSKWTGRRMSKRRALRMRMLWDFSRDSVHVPAGHTLARTMKAIEPKLTHIWTTAIVEQLRRHRAFGY